MRFCTVACLLAFARLGFAFIVPRENQKEKYLKVDLEKSWGETFESSTNEGPEHAWKLAKRAENYLWVEYINMNYFYATELQIGTPPQKVAALLDTGSSDLWVPGANVDCNPQKFEINCKKYGSFDKTASTSWSGNGSTFFISYVDTAYATGELGVDVIYLEGTRIEGMSFGVADHANKTIGILGLGMPELELTNFMEPSYQYDNLPSLLKRQGIIARNVYSIFNNLRTERSGTLIFGGIDHKKYTGPLVTLPVLKMRNGKHIDLQTTVNGFGVSDDNDLKHTITASAFPATLDTGTTFMGLEESVLKIFMDAVGASWRGNIGAYVGPCLDDKFVNPTIDFNFGGLMINVPYDVFVVRGVVEGECLYNIFGVGRRASLFGDIILSSLYVVFDLEEKEISIAQAAYNEEEDIEPIITSVPGAVRAPGYDQIYDYSVPVVPGGGDIYECA
ncbi:HBR084Cp [Eremothecium sinecaudum]|uniref:HBR084Cp n=1 Tax=Eremothecium sinecaudum TaxID=45286 RepID=A0A125RDZ4_9SACH|nr:HBR084Cp [Eremothecium sinecaudum]AMD18985.1 HBR084Cp [Eremothecium sinecaudum]